MPTYHLPGSGRIRIESQRRYVLVRDFARTGDRPSAAPYIERRSDSFDTLARLFRPASDFLIDQVSGTARYRPHAGAATMTAVVTGMARTVTR